MLRFAIRAGLLTCLSLALCGCLSLGAIATRGTAINEGVGTLQNRSILLNMVRASLGEPLYFTSIDQVLGQGAADLKLEAPQVATPGNTVTWNSGGSTGLDNSTSTSLQMSVYGTHDFYAGLMAPLTLDEINLLLHQDFSRELIFYLTIEKAKITPPQGRPLYIYNNPADHESYRRFVRAIEVAMEHGLTTEAAPTPDNQTPSKTVTPVAAAGAINFVLKDDTSGPGAQECFDQALATPAANAEFDKLTAEGISPNFCGAGKHSTSQTVYLNGPDKPPVQVEVIFRSTYGVFHYVGAMLNGGEAPSLVDYGVQGEETPAGPILTVKTRSVTGEACFTAVVYAGTHYCAPRQGEGAATTRQIFSVLTSLVALKQSPGDLPASQSVLIAR
jgi:hypothetical protein